jgi:acetyl esterase/lipase
VPATLALGLTLGFIALPSACGQQSHDPAVPSARLDLWPGTPPGDNGLELPPERDTSGPEAKQVAGRPVIRLGNVTTPQLEIFRPPAGTANGAAVVICPGGGHYILAYDLEGTEVAAWLTSLGVTAAVLKYRVPARENRPRYEAAVQDAQRAVSLLRSRADSLKIDPQRIGILGFSAGGQTAALTALMAERLYERIDVADEVSQRPDFAVLIYAADLVDDDQPTRLNPEVTVGEAAPPMFLVHTWDDENTPQSSLQLAVALKRVHVPCELHLFARGGHGYGMRPTELAVTRWPGLCEQWLRDQGWLEP